MAPKLSELVNNCNVDVGSHYPTWRTGYIPWAFWSVTRSCLVFILIYHACHGTYMGWAQANLFDCCMDTVTTTILGGFCSYLFYHFLDNILHDMAWILFAAYWRRLREIALQGFNGGTQERMGLRTFGALDVINRPLAKHSALEDKRKKAEKKKSSATKLRFHISRRDYCFYYIFFVDCLHHDSMACGGYSSFFHHFIFHLTVVDVRHFCWDCYICSFFLSALVIWYRFIIPCIGSFLYLFLW